MTYIIAEPCVNTTDTACVDVCPVDCIYINDENNPKTEEKGLEVVSNIIMENSEPMDTLFIHPEECIDCGACEPECPVQAIFPEDEVPEEWSNFIKLNYEAFGMDAPD